MIRLLLLANEFAPRSFLAAEAKRGEERGGDTARIGDWVSVPNTPPLENGIPSIGSETVRAGSMRGPELCCTMPVNNSLF